jgi:hypothetical protein
MARRIALCLLAVATLACGEPERLPAELIGIWRTPSPGFLDSYFELRDGWVVFGADRYRISMYPIHRIESSRSGDTTEYAIEYVTEDDAILPLVLVYTPATTPGSTPGTPPSLKVGRRPELWFPESQADWLQKEAS